MEMFVNSNFDFIKWRFAGVAVSLVIILAGVGGYFAHGVNIGIDFSGGANVVLRFQESPPLQQLRELAPSATIQQYGRADENSVLIRLPKLEEEADYAGIVVRGINDALNAGTAGKLDLNYQGATAIAQVLIDADPDGKGSDAAARESYLEIARDVIDNRSDLGIFHDMTEVKGSPGLTPAAFAVLEQRAALGAFNVLNQETVGPQVGKDLQKRAALAIILSVIAMGIYVAVRFDLKFGVAALIGLFHDVLVSLAFLIWLGGEFSLNTVAAFLMVVGYSINDTVVIYDRVRENAKKVRAKETFADLMNRSLNQTLERTILTGTCVMVILVCIIAMGGEVIKDFAWLLLVGSICGSYSTLTIVPAIVLAWNKYLAKKAGLYGGGPAPASARNGA